MDTKEREKAIPKSDWAFLVVNLGLLVWVLVDIARDGGNVVPWIVVSVGVVTFTSWVAWRRTRRSKL